MEADKAKKPKTKLIIIILAIVVVLLGAIGIMYQTGISPADSNSKDKIYVTVAEGDGASSVLNKLDEKGLVRNKTFAKIHLKLASPDRIQVNTYMFTKSMSVDEMFRAMETGDAKYILRSKITVIEGATIPEVAKAVADELGISRKEVLKKWKDKTYLSSLIDKYWFITDDVLNKDLKYPLEGYLYPDTYFLTSENPTVEEATSIMLNKMDQELTPIKDEIQTKRNMSIHEFLSFASVVEAESLFDKDRPKIAGVFVNRLAQNMPLQSDITVLYVLGEKRPNVSIAETKIDSKYNTYKYPGVPVGPVCAVQRATMDDCLGYEKNDYLYFFATQDGTVIYSKTYAEHQKNVNENKWY